MTTITHFDQLQLAKPWGGVIGAGPKYIRLPGKVIYCLCDIEAYENECLALSTAEFRNHTKLSEQPVAAARR